MFFLSSKLQNLPKHYGLVVESNYLMLQIYWSLHFYSHFTKPK